jgi:hypothetical protein
MYSQAGSTADGSEEFHIHGGNSDTMSVSHFRNDTEEEERSQDVHIDMIGLELSLRGEPQSYRQSPFHIIDGVLEDVLVGNLLIYLNAEDVTQFSMVSKAFLRICSSNHLWNAMYRRDFFVDEFPDQQSETASQISIRPTLHSAVTFQTAAPTLFTKLLYVRRHREYFERIEAAKEDHAQTDMEAVRSARALLIENILDFSQARFIAPLVVGCIFLTIVLVAQKIDGLDIEYWMCFIPILVALLYIIVSCRVLQLVYINRHSEQSMFYNMWSNFRGPLVFIFDEIIVESSKVVQYFMFLVVLAVLQVMLVATKLSSATPDSIRSNLAWAVVFIPIWLLCVLHFVLPFLYSVNPGAYISCTTVLFMPACIFMACLAAKLQAQEDHGGSGKIRLAVVLLPFWLVEGVALMSCLMLIAISLMR